MSDDYAPNKRGRARRFGKWAGGIGGSIVVLIIGIAIGAAAGKSGNATPKAAPAVTVYATPKAAPTVTVTKYAAPKPVKGQTLISASGTNQNWNSSPFNIGNDPVTVSYSYSGCPSGNGNFIADLITAGVTQSSGNYDDINIANAIGAGASNTTVEYPQQSGAKYYLAIQTECTYSVKVTSGG